MHLKHQIKAFKKPFFVKNRLNDINLEQRERDEKPASKMLPNGDQTNSKHSRMKKKIKGSQMEQEVR